MSHLVEHVRNSLVSFSQRGFYVNTYYMAHRRRLVGLN